MCYVCQPTLQQQILHTQNTLKSREKKILRTTQRSHKPKIKHRPVMTSLLSGIFVPHRTRRSKDKRRRKGADVFPREKLNAETKPPPGRSDRANSCNQPTAAHTWPGWDGAHIRHIIQVLQVRVHYLLVAVSSRLRIECQEKETPPLPERIWRHQIQQTK